MDDQELLDNIDGRMHGPMSGFIKRYFGNLQCDPQDATLATTPSPDDFLEWFSSHASGEFDGARGSWQIPEHESDNDGARLLVTIPASPASDVQTKWEDVQRRDSRIGKLYLEVHPIASRERLVGTGTTCYRSRTLNSDRWDYVLKFKWRWARDRPEDELLKLASEKCVWGSVSLDYYKEIESTSNLRRSMRWGKHRKFAVVDRNNEQREEAASNATGLVDYTEETGDFFQNRILACVVTSPVGRPLGTFHTLLELLQVFHDAIKCHRSLYHDARILHQDISPGNIIILDSKDEQMPKGILIDLDSAIELAELLETEPGNYRHQAIHSYRRSEEGTAFLST
ncbi:hypothetical protein V499_06424 [Pseudogymnoascus sp. VKM F-103]|nr:hypothetical protein V499_06424 [Pseudogymnoascus sp. VKM F-103]